MLEKVVAFIRAEEGTADDDPAPALPTRPPRPSSNGSGVLVRGAVVLAIEHALSPDVLDAELLERSRPAQPVVMR